MIDMNENVDPIDVKTMKVGMFLSHFSAFLTGAWVLAIAAGASVPNNWTWLSFSTLFCFGCLYLAFVGSKQTMSLRDKCSRVAEHKFMLDLEEKNGDL